MQKSEGELKETKKQNFLFLALACATNCFVVDSILYPLDTLKCRIHYEMKEFTSLYNGFITLYQKEGLKRFFNGYSTVAASSFTSNFVWFYCYENLNKIFATFVKSEFKDSKYKDITYRMIPFVSGALGEIASLIFYIPFNIIKVRMQVGGEYSYSSIFHGFKDIYTNEGLFRFYKASHLFIMNNILQTGLQFTFYENLRKAAKEYRGADRLAVTDSLIVCAGTSALLNFFINPIDLIITRYQMANTNGNSGADNVKVRTILWNLLKNEGPIALFKGCSTRTAMTFFNMSLYIPIYDYIRYKYGFELN
jgi:Mitochondrial carrier protein.